MIDLRFATDQVARMMGLDYFPSEPKVQREIIDMLRWSKTEAIAVAVINEWITDNPRRPTPADIRRVVANHNERWEQLLSECGRSKCSVCGGCGMTVHDFLVTYNGKTLAISQSENIDHLNFEQISDLRKKLPEHQAILSGARDCYNCKGRRQ